MLNTRSHLRGTFTVAALLLTLGLVAACERERASSAGDEAPAARVATKTFTNSRATAVAPQLQENYIDFAFDYPEAWSIDPATGTADASNFVKVVRPLVDDVDTETFAVGYLTMSGNPEADTSLLPQVMTELQGMMVSGFPNARIVSEGNTEVGGRPGREFRFQSDVPAEGAREAVTLWGRVVVVPPPAGQKTGLALVMLASNKAPEIQGPADVGVKGQTPVILDSFRFTGPAAG